MAIQSPCIFKLESSMRSLGRFAACHYNPHSGKLLGPGLATSSVMFYHSGHILGGHVLVRRSSLLEFRMTSLPESLQVRTSRQVHCRFGMTFLELPACATSITAGVSAARYHLHLLSMLYIASLHGCEMFHAQLRRSLLLNDKPCRGRQL